MPKKSIIQQSSTRKGYRLIYKCKTANRKDIFKIDLAILTPLQNMRISGPNIYTKLWRKVKKHYLILSIESKGRRQKKLSKEVVKTIQAMMNFENAASGS